MLNHPLYKKLKQMVLDGNYTIEQVRSLDFDAAVELLGTRNFSAGFLHNMKWQLIAELQEQKDESSKQLFQSKIEVLRNRFPDFEIERGRIDNKPFITIWLKGKPEVE